jgi:CO/xanthine dehydrogenase FAD-binding subunit
VPLSALAVRHGELVTAVAFQTGGRGAAERVARTPADDPIVAAVARVGDDGEVRLALCGVGNRPVLLFPSDLDTLAPPGDFRGSAAYRREMAALLTRRVLAALEEK